MPTRFYFPSTGTPPVTAITGPGWLHTGFVRRRPLLLAKTDSPITEVTNDPGGGSGKTQFLTWQHVFVLPKAVTLGGTFQLVMGGRETDDNANAGLQCRIHIMDSTGATVLQTLFAGEATINTSAPPHEFTVGVDGVETVRILTGNIAAFNAPANSLLVVETGSRQTYSGSLTGRYGVLSVGDPAVGNLPATLGSPGGVLAPWIEFSNSLIPPNPPTNLNTKEATMTSLEFEWATPTTGVPDKYEHRLDGGGVTDAALTTTAAFTGLVADSDHTFDVRSVAGGAPSEWRSINASTLAAPTYPLSWDDPNEREYQTGCDHGAIYFDDGSAVAWNGVTGVDETGTGTSSVLYRDGNIYYADSEPSDFTATVRAFFWPDEFSRCLGIPEITDGLYIDNQKPRKFNFSYQNLVGSGGRGDRFGRQIHLVYNAVATLGQRSRKTRTASVTLDEFQFDLVCTPVKMPGFRPSAHYILDTRGMDATTIKMLEDILYVEGRMPSPGELFDLMSFGDSITFIDHGNGTWTARGSRENIIDHGNGTWTIKNVNGTDHGDGTFTLVDTP